MIIFDDIDQYLMKQYYYTALASQLLMDFISGRLGGEKEIKIASQVVRVIVAGNSVVTTDVVKGKDR